MYKQQEKFKNEWLDTNGIEKNFYKRKILRN